LTGAGILRGAGHIFLALGPEPGEEQQSPSEEEREQQDRPVWLMLLPIGAMLASELVLQAFPIESAVRAAAASFAATGSVVATVLDGAAWSSPPVPPGVTETHMMGPIIGLSVALGIAALELGRHHFPRYLVRVADLALGWIFSGLDRLHNGIVGDYVAWLMVGLLTLGGVLAIG
jgi:multicomponent Na+:H+ antiporter subunit D